MANDVLSTVNSAQPATPLPNQNTTLTPDTINQALNILESLLAHTHSFVDNYGTNCNCNCNCDCNCNCNCDGN